MAKEVNTPTISLNLRPYCNLLYPYTTINTLDKQVILDDVRYWAEVLKDIDVIMESEKKVVASSPPPPEVETVTKCKTCGGSNLVFSSGKSKATNKMWYAFDCQDCSTERSGVKYPTRNFANAKQVASANASNGMGLADDDDVPF